MIKRNLLSVGMNRKLGKQIGIFNLPPGNPEICIGMSDICRQFCYARKAYRYRNVKSYRNRNYEVVLNYLKERGRLANELELEIRERGIKMVRVHESGDFFNQAYLDEWIEVAKRLPEVKFLAYTKSTHLDFSKKPDNFIIYESYDCSKKSVLDGIRHPKAYLLLPGEEPPEGYILCQPRGGRNYCGKRCKICWIGKANVYFIKH